jgi:hypothetical protein
MPARKRHPRAAPGAYRRRTSSRRPRGAATDAQLLRRHAPARVYGHALRDGGRLWLQYWLFCPDNPQDRGIVRSGRHEGDREMLQVGLGRDGRPQ